ncbi:flavin monoamine oxidase family protein [Dermacoccaceae bacterium W4C1]
MTQTHEKSVDGQQVDVVIVGAGFSGLTAAEILAGQGRSVLVVDGRDRVGGRSYSGEVAGVQVDLGATWVADRHTAVHALMDKVGCTTTPQFDDGNNVLWMAGQRQTYLGALPNGGPVDQEDLGRVAEAFAGIIEAVDVEKVWDTPGAAEFDAITFEQWLNEQQAAPSTRALMTVISQVQWGCSTSDVSLLHAARYVAAAGGLEHQLAVEGGQNQDRVAGGTQSVAERLADALGDKVVLGAPVRRIIQEGEGVSVETDAGTVRARAVISTTSPTHRRDIAFEPPLPAQTRGLDNTWPLGTLSKAFVAYERPFWREEDLSGEAVLDTGAVFITFDVSPSDDGPGIVMAFCEPGKYDGFNAEDRKRRVVGQLVDLYGEQAANPIDYVDHCWGQEEFAPGGPNPAVGPFAITSYGPALAQPHGRVHFAGSETAGMWAGTLNGAVLTGQRAAREVERMLTAAH